ncbi:hypothetical protein [Yoonia sp. R78084]|uniref:hypothetical protein n=1 Tax=Yoonia sp. R78084 TaxID=3093869 RepID=UPI0037DCE915
MKTRRCHVLVDWWGQARSVFFANRNASPGHCSETTLRNVEAVVETALNLEKVQPERWDVSFRLYAGWMSGTKPTSILNDYQSLKDGYAKRRRIGSLLKSALFLPATIGLDRGDRLLADKSGKRLEKRSSTHFPFTARVECGCPLCEHMGKKAPDGFVCERFMEKQVDTALVADAISLSIDSEKSKILIVSNDDDMMPALIAGESLGGDISLINTVRKRHTHAQHLRDLIHGPEEASL